MQESPITEAPDERVTRPTVLTFGVSDEERDGIRRLAAEYGARLGRPVSVAEYLRAAALQQIAA